MDREALSPDNNSAGKVEQGEIVIGFLFETDEKLTETVEKGMSYFYAPTSRLKIRIGLFLLFLFSSGTNMGGIPPRFDKLCALRIACVHAKMLRMFWRCLWTINDDVLQSGL